MKWTSDGSENSYEMRGIDCAVGPCSFATVELGKWGTDENGVRQSESLLLGSVELDGSACGYAFGCCCSVLFYGEMGAFFSFYSGTNKT